MIFRVLALVLANLSVSFCAWGIMTRLSHQGTISGALRVPVLLLVRLLLISLGVLIVAFAGRLDPLGLLAVCLVPSLIFLAAVGLPPRSTWTRASRRVWGAPLLCGVGVVSLRLLLQTWFFAPVNGDVLSYHLPKVAEWVRAGGFVRELGVDSHASFPAGFELIETFWVGFLHHDVVIELAGLEFAVLAFAAMRALGDWLRLTPRESGSAALLFILTPTFHLQLTSCLNDAAVAAMVLATAALVVHRAPWPLLVCAAALGLGIKPIYGYALPGLGALALLQRNEGRRPPGGELGAWLALGAMLVSAFWYVRNWSWFGNPVHPMGASGVLETSGFVTIQFGPSLSGFWANLVELFGHRIIDSAAPYSQLGRGVAGFGAVSVACAPALILALRDDQRLRHLAASLGLCAAVVLLLIRTDLWFARFLAFLPAVFVLAAVRLCRAQRGIGIITGLAGAVMFLATFLPGELPWSSARTLASQRWQERSEAAVLAVPSLPSIVGYYADNYGEAYVLYGPDFSRRVVYLRAMDPRTLRAEMLAAGIDTLYAVPGTIERTQVITAAQQKGVLRPVSARVFRLAEQVP